MGSSKQAEIHKFQTRRESQVKAKHRSQLNGNLDSQMSSFQPNYLPTEDFVEDGATGIRTLFASISDMRSVEVYDFVFDILINLTSFIVKLMGKQVGMQG